MQINRVVVYGMYAFVPPWNTLFGLVQSMEFQIILTLWGWKTDKEQDSTEKIRLLE